MATNDATLSPPERSPLAELLLLGGPAVAQMVSYALMQFLDTAMLSHVGDGIDAPTAASNGGFVAIAVLGLGMGVLWVVNTLVSQNFAHQHRHECGRYLWQGVWFAVGFGALAMAAMPLTPHLFRWAGHPSHLAELESVYLRIVLGAAIVKLVGTAVAQFLLAIGRPGAVGISTAIGVSANALAAWALIFGHLGAHRMGVVGSAWAQNIGVGVETTVLIVVAAQRGVRHAYGLRAWGFAKAEMRLLMKVGLPSGLQAVAEIAAWTLFVNVVMAQLGERAMAATSFMLRYMMVSFMPAIGISMAVTALVGRYIGAGKLEIARKRAHLGFAVTWGYALLCGLVFVVFRYPMMRLFTSDPQVLKMGAVLLIIAAVYELFDAMYIVYVSALRGAGDTLKPALVTASLCWGIMVGGGYLVARLWPQWGPQGPWTVATTYGIILSIFMALRFRRGQWVALRPRPLEQPLAADTVVNQSTQESGGGLHQTIAAPTEARTTP